MDKRKLSETDIISKFILPAVKTAGWDDITQIRQEVKLRDGKVIVRGQLGVRKTVKSADIVLYHKPSMPLAVIEAKANKHEVGKGLQQGLDYARLLDVPFIFASNGDGFIFHDKTKLGTPDAHNLETEIRLEDFPSPQELWAKYCAYKGYTESQLSIINQAYYDDGSGRHPRYYQLQAINKTVEAISSSKDRVLLSSSMKNVSREQIRSLAVALSPQKEQHRIVTKVDELMTLCDQLKARLNDAQTTKLHFTDAIVEQAL
ncbi:type I restriction enzyme, R subunit [Pseudoalteromonas sp. BSi20495]|nr:type I restriction enzyme, R subunit [Pseudoalteromonas sp. BSi20495]